LKDSRDKRAFSLSDQLVLVQDDDVDRAPKHRSQRVAYLVGPTSKEAILLAVGCHQKKVDVTGCARLAACR